MKAFVSQQGNLHCLPTLHVDTGARATALFLLVPQALHLPHLELSSTTLYSARPSTSPNYKRQLPLDSTAFGPSDSQSTLQSPDWIILISILTCNPPSQMLSRRIARASAARPATSAIAARRLPLIQTRTFLPRYNDKVDELYPASDYPELTEAQDPNQVCTGSWQQRPKRSSGRRR